VAAYYEDFTNRTESARQLARARAYESLAAKYPDDDEAQIFYALYLIGTQTASDQTYSAYLKAAAILEKQFAKHPDHPGVAHYLIHSYDAPANRHAGPARGAPLRRHRARCAARAAHAVAHLHPRRAWADSVATNRRSPRLLRRINEPDEAVHAMDYMTYAYLQLAATATRAGPSTRRAR